MQRRFTSRATQPHRFPKTKRPKPRWRDVSRAARVLERTQRFVNALGCQLERAEMHADALGRLEIQVRLHGLRRIQVNGLHEPARLVGAGTAPLIVGDTVLFGTNYPGLDGSGAWVAVSLDDGQELWSHDIAPFSGAPLLVANRVVVASRDGAVWCLEASSARVIWQRAMRKHLAGSPAHSEDTIYVGGFDHHLYAIANHELVDRFDEIEEAGLSNSRLSDWSWAAARLGGKTIDAVISSTGLGDGVYDVLAGYDTAGKLCRIRIVFIDA